MLYLHDNCFCCALIQAVLFIWRPYFFDVLVYKYYLMFQDFLGQIFGLNPVSVSFKNTQCLTLLNNTLNRV